MLNGSFYNHTIFSVKRRYIAYCTDSRNVRERKREIVFFYLLKHTVRNLPSKPRTRQFFIWVSLALNMQVYKRVRLRQHISRLVMVEYYNIQAQFLYIFRFFHGAYSVIYRNKKLCAAPCLLFNCFFAYAVAFLNSVGQSDAYLGAHFFKRQKHNG